MRSLLSPILSVLWLFILFYSTNQAMEANNNNSWLPIVKMTMVTQSIVCDFLTLEEVFAYAQSCKKLYKAIVNFKKHGPIYTLTKIAGRNIDENIAKNLKYLKIAALPNIVLYKINFRYDFVLTKPDDTELTLFRNEEVKKYETFFTTKDGKEMAGIQSDGTIMISSLPANTNQEYKTKMKMKLKNVKQIYSNEGAMAAVTKEGNVITWGDPLCGGDSEHVQNDLKQVEKIYSTNRAFAAVTKNKNVITWGNPDFCQKVRDTPLRKSEYIKKIVSAGPSAGRAFSILTNEGNVFTWECVGEKPQFIENVKDIFVATEMAFAALTNSGSVYIWSGLLADGEDLSKIERFPHVKTIHISSTKQSFAALTDDGRIITWGHFEFGGRWTSTTKLKIKMIFSTDYAYAVLLENQEVLTWGDEKFGGDSELVQSKLKNIKMIFSTEGAFAALTKEGRVVTWGSPEYGGDSSKVVVKNALEQTVIKTIIPSKRNFIAKPINEDDDDIEW